MIAFCPLAKTGAALAEFQPAAVVSLVSPKLRIRRLAGRPHLILKFHDIEAPRRGCRPPSRPAMASIVDRARTTAAEGGRLLIHCKAGLSRAPAGALIAAWAVLGEPEARIAELAALAPWAQPNRLMVALGAQVLGLEATPLLAALAEAFPIRPRKPWGAVGPGARLVTWDLQTLPQAKERMEPCRPLPI